MPNQLCVTAAGGLGIIRVMKVFLSWSGERSQQTAEALRDWMRGVIQSADPWISVDMDRGVKWLSELAKSLDERAIGIFCVTPENATAPWLLFEAGAMSRHLGDEGRVIPYLLGFNSPSDLKAPLGQFNASLADEAGTWQLVRTLNDLAEFKLDDTALRKTFDLWWPELRDRLASIGAGSTSGPLTRRSDSEKLDEVLAVVRKIDKGTPSEIDAGATKLAIENERKRATGSMIREAVQSAAVALGLPVTHALYGSRGSLELIVEDDTIVPTEQQMDVLLAVLHTNPRIRGTRIELLNQEESQARRANRSARRQSDDD